jgi:hypothetical protein
MINKNFKLPQKPSKVLICLSVFPCRTAYTTVVVTKLHVSGPRKDFTPLKLCHRYSVASFTALLVMSCHYSPELRCSCCNVVRFYCNLEACNLVTATIHMINMTDKLANLLEATMEIMDGATKAKLICRNVSSSYQVSGSSLICDERRGPLISLTFVVNFLSFMSLRVSP